MKSYRVAAIVFMTLVGNVKGQVGSTFSKSSYIEPYALEVTYNKTTNLIFPAAITSVDRGSADILVQKATGVENILRVKADVRDFSETSLSVITSDGKLYSFVVIYAKQPSYLNINVGKISNTNVPMQVAPMVEQQVIYSEPVLDKTFLSSYADSVLYAGPNMRSLHAKGAKVKVSLNGIYIHNDVVFCRLAFMNDSGISYEIDQLRFYIRDKRKAKRTASQELEIIPLMVSGDTVTIGGDTKVPWVVSLPKFTIPDSKYLLIEVTEKNGGRNLSLKVKGKHILRAETI